MKKLKKEKKKYFICPMCGTRHDIQKTKELAIMSVRCKCGCASFIQIKNGYHIPSKQGSETIKLK